MRRGRIRGWRAFCGTLGNLLRVSQTMPQIVDPDTLCEIGRCGIGAAISMPSRSSRAA